MEGVRGAGLDYNHRKNKGMGVWDMYEYVPLIQQSTMENHHIHLQHHDYDLHSTVYSTCTLYIHVCEVKCTIMVSKRVT